MEIFWVVLIIQGIVFGGFCSFIASQKNRDTASWFFLGLFFSLIAVLALIAIPKDNSPDQPNLNRVCPFCAEQIKEKAKVCRFCQNDLPEPDVEQSLEPENNDEFIERENRIVKHLQKKLNREPTEKEIEKAKWDGIEL
ncbi:hypothetical protein bplSymb_SCF09103P001 [Bathymodiolus platifrons methanotrophic gill symbiont]|uniref:hypothetical protein n=1 Tax=Bathymodiolus platifrons methanotrophic gill symbiont TaxID=113268 RepID=UPI000B412EB4|nr:hypothetical protein [Bathymodiolus platifrons methanotrophic gill symbiont]TXK92733.1 hypothetical protein BMR11_18170 [Methylococcaceae bacterium CS5]TXK98996.1 hypothetical protein BMR10_01125 [Methylococcaceae bacterium CS4]TXL03095.1 hypothetical protein BMR07_16195 [Methylococcaceae bacterium CS1]TXL05211.1 hypothetical protein BMR08_16235 [Methylococcaceae bacterium CS2]GAW87483.1 hypothetical protein bplSymb_SCF09103P001 [Bathymodiolus platifrons methanotrophic gill symbiont]